MTTPRKKRTQAPKSVWMIINAFGYPVQIYDDEETAEHVCGETECVVRYVPAKRRTK